MNTYISYLIYDYLNMIDDGIELFLDINNRKNAAMDEKDIHLIYNIKGLDPGIYIFILQYI